MVFLCVGMEKRAVALNLNERQHIYQITKVIFLEHVPLPPAGKTLKDTIAIFGGKNGETYLQEFFSIQ